MLEDHAARCRREPFAGSGEPRDRASPRTSRSGIFGARALGSWLLLVLLLCSLARADCFLPNSTLTIDKMQRKLRLAIWPSEAEECQSFPGTYTVTIDTQSRTLSGEFSDMDLRDPQVLDIPCPEDDADCIDECAKTLFASYTMQGEVVGEVTFSGDVSRVMIDSYSRDRCWSDAHIVYQLESAEKAYVCMNVVPAKCEFPESAADKFTASLRLEDRATGELVELDVPPSTAGGSGNAGDASGDFSIPYVHMSTTRFCHYCRDASTDPQVKECYHSLLRFQTFNTASASLRLSARIESGDVYEDVSAEAATSAIHSKAFQHCYDFEATTLIVYSDRYSMSLRTSSGVSCRRPSMTERVLCRIALYDNQNMGLATIVHYQLKYDDSYEIRNGLQTFTCGSPHALSQEDFLDAVSEGSAALGKDLPSASSSASAGAGEGDDGDLETVAVLNSLEAGQCKQDIHGIFKDKAETLKDLSAFFSALFLDEGGEVIDSVRVTTSNVVFACHSRLQLYLYGDSVCFEMVPNTDMTHCQYDSTRQRSIYLYLIHNSGSSVDQQKGLLTFGQFYNTAEFNVATRVCFDCSINWIQNEDYFGGNSCSRQIRNIKKYHSKGSLISYVMIDGVSWLVDAVYDSNYVPYYITVGILAAVAALPMLVWLVISIVTVKCHKTISFRGRKRGGAGGGGRGEQEGPTRIGGEGGFQSSIEEAAGAGPEL